MTDAVTRALRAALEAQGRQRQLRRQVLISLIESAPSGAVVSSPLGAVGGSPSGAGGSVFDELYDPETGLPR